MAICVQLVYEHTSGMYRWMYSMKTPLKKLSEHNTFSLSYKILPLKESNFYVSKITSKLAGDKVSIK